MSTTRTLAWVAAACAFALIVLGGVVRITGSGMGCGDDWPLCNGHLFPPLDDIATVIEWSHRMVAAFIGLVTVALVGAAFRSRTQHPPAGRTVWRLTLLSLPLLVLVGLLGRATVMLELPPWTVILHLSLAMSFLALLLVIGLRAGESLDPAAAPAASGKDYRAAVVALVLAAATVLLGGLTANFDAAGACLGFPLCNGQILPDGGAAPGLVHTHWTHRLAAYALTLHLIGMVIAMRRRGSPPRVRAAAEIGLGFTVAQVAVAAVMILSILQPHWRALHVAFGTAVWAVMVLLVWRVRAGRRVT